MWYVHVWIGRNIFHDERAFCSGRKFLEWSVAAKAEFHIGYFGQGRRRDFLICRHVAIEADSHGHVTMTGGRRLSARLRFVAVQAFRTLDNTVRNYRGRCFFGYGFSG